jgi:hypothetical protein
MAKSIGNLAIILTADPSGAVQGFQAAQKAGQDFAASSRQADYGRQKLKEAEDQARRTADALGKGRPGEGGASQEQRERDRATAATERYIKALEKELVLFGKSSRERKLWELEQKGASKEKLQRARELEEQLGKKEADAQKKDRISETLDKASGFFGGVGGFVKEGLDKLGPAGKVASVALATLAATFKMLMKDAEAYKEKARETAEALHLQSRRAEQLGMSAEALRGFHLAAKRAGVETDLLESYMLRLSGTLGEIGAGNKDAASSFQAIGLSGAEIANLNLDEAFLRLADHISALPSHSERAAAAIQIFGSRGREMVNVLSQGAAAIRFQELTAKNYGLTLDRLGESQLRQLRAKENELKMVQGGQDVKSAQIWLPQQMASAQRQIDDLQRLESATLAYQRTLARLSDRWESGEMTRRWKVLWTEMKTVMAEATDQILSLFMRQSEVPLPPWMQRLEQGGNVVQAAQQRLGRTRREGGDTAGAERELMNAQAEFRRIEQQAFLEGLEARQRELENQQGPSNNPDQIRQRLGSGLAAAISPGLGLINIGRRIFGGSSVAASSPNLSDTRQELEQINRQILEARENQQDFERVNGGILRQFTERKEMERQIGEMESRNLTQAQAAGNLDEWERRRYQMLALVKGIGPAADADRERINDAFRLEALEASRTGIERFRRQIEELGQTQQIAANIGQIYGSQLAGLRGSTLAWTEAQLAANLAQARQRDDWRRGNAEQRQKIEDMVVEQTETQRLTQLRTEANQLISQNRTAGEQAADEMDRLNEMLDEGMISAAVYNRALTGVADRFGGATQGPAALLSGSAAAISAINRAQRGDVQADPMRRLENIMGQDLAEQRDQLEELRRIARALEIEPADLFGG